MAIDFPNSPNVNDTYTVDDKTFIWTGDYWRVLNSPNYISTLIKDADNDTKVEVEQSADEDTVRITTGGTERYSIGTDGHIIPTANEAYDLGSASNRFRDLYLSGTSIDLGGVSITSDGTNLALPPISSVSGDFTVDTDTLHVDSTNNRVGIGTTSPARTLEVQSSSGAVANFGSAVSNAYITFTDSGTTSNTHVRVGSAGDEMRFYAGDAERVRIDSSGNVGIGTTSPSADLHIADTSTILHLQDTDGTVGGSMSSMIQFTDSTGAVQSQVGLGTGTGYFIVDNNDGPMRVGTASADNLYLRTNNANQLTIDATGNVGINDTTPSYTLDVNGDIRATGAIYNNGVITSNGTSTRDKIRVWDSFYYTIGMQSGVTFGPLNDYAMTFQMNNDSDRGFWWGDYSHGVNQGAMALSTNGNLYVANSIKVNFGETNTSQTYNYAVEANGGFYSNSSYVSRPAASATGFYLNPQLPNTGGGRAMDIRACSDSSSAPFQFLTGNSFAFVTDGTTRLTIDNGGISKSGGSFDIQHPLEPTDSTSRLRHGFLEGPYNDNVYRGTAVLDSSGEASIDLDTHFGMREGTWLALNTNPWVMAAVNGGASVTWALNGKVLTLTGSVGDSVQWIVIGERHDPHMTSDKNTSTDANGRLILEYIREWEDEDGYTPPFLETDETGDAN
jgi:predicted ribosome-associated RNA-binding protein Tma20